MQCMAASLCFRGWAPAMLRRPALLRFLRWAPAVQRRPASLRLTRRAPPAIATECHDGNSDRDES
jgi:hypothetical protein